MTDLWAVFLCTHTANRIYDVQIKAINDSCIHCTITCAQDWRHKQNQVKNILTYTLQATVTVDQRLMLKNNGITFSTLHLTNAI
jgi:hypothetical protein